MSDIDQRICKILSQMLEKKPAGQVITPAVAIKILDSKFKEAFGGLNFADKTSVIKVFLDEKQKVVASVSSSSAPKKKAAASDSEDSSASDSSDSDDEESEGEEEEDEEDESVFDDSDEDEGTEEPEAKKHRAEMLAGGDVSARVEAMLACARKVGYRPKAMESSQTPQTYLDSYLIPFFEGKGMDPTLFGEEDMKRYRKLKEVQELERDGANVNLDRASRRGRGVLAPPPPAAPKPSFMDDDE